MFCSSDDGGRRDDDDDDGFDSYQLNPFFCCIGINVAIFHSARCTPAEFKVREGGEERREGGQIRSRDHVAANFLSYCVRVTEIGPV